MFTLGGGVVSWRSVNQSNIVGSTTEAGYVVAFETTKEVVWLQKFLMGLGVVPLVLFYDNCWVVTQFKEPRNH